MFSGCKCSGVSVKLVTQITGIASVSLLFCTNAFTQSRHTVIQRSPSANTSSNVREFSSIAVSNKRPADHVTTHNASDTQVTIINENNNNLTNSPFVTPAFETRTLPDSPGLGFDFAHMAAVGRGQTVSVPAGFISSGFFLPTFSQPAPVILVQPSPVVIVQQPALQQLDDSVDRPRSSRLSEDRPAPPPPETAPVRDVGEFVLVRRDGGQVLAVAFTVQNGQISYVTRDGVRRSVSLSALDLDATRNENEERGTSIRLPAP